MEQTVIPKTPMPAEMPDASPSVKGGKKRMQELTPAKRRALGQKAAKARWGKGKTGLRRTNSAVSASDFLPARQTRQKQHKGVFGIALTAAEKRLARAIEERARAAATWAVLNAEIPSLQRTIAALRNQENPNTSLQNNYTIQLPDGSIGNSQGVTGSYDLATVVSDAPVPFAQPAPSPAQPQTSPLHRSLVASRVGGGAVGVNLADDEDEDKFLEESGVAAGKWH